MMATTTVSELRLKAAQQDESASVILLLMVAAVTASLLGIVAELSRARQSIHPAADLAFIPLCTIVLSWASMHAIFATHYVHLYYAAARDQERANPGLQFPERYPAPGYMKFVYFSFCIGMTYQVSDVMVLATDFRRLVTRHGALSFFYNTFVLALAVGLFGTLPGLPNRLRGYGFGDLFVEQWIGKDELHHGSSRLAPAHRGRAAHLLRERLDESRADAAAAGLG